MIEKTITVIGGRIFYEGRTKTWYGRKPAYLPYWFF